ncbi:hypothetical protein CYMTET_44790, partial [Cymbomonas tetramitiformis]
PELGAGAKLELTEGNLHGTVHSHGRLERGPRRLERAAVRLEEGSQTAQAADSVGWSQAFLRLRRAAGRLSDSARGAWLEMWGRVARRCIIARRRGLGKSASRRRDVTCPLSTGTTAHDLSQPGSACDGGSAAPDALEASPAAEAKLSTAVVAVFGTPPAARRDAAARRIQVAFREVRARSDFWSLLLIEEERLVEEERLEAQLRVMEELVQ